MRRLSLRVVSALIPLWAILTIALPAQAVIWCKTDPVVSLNGRLVDIQVDIPLEYVTLVDGPTLIDVQTPKSVVRKLVFNGPGFNGHGETVAFANRSGSLKNGQFPTTVQVRVPIDESKLAAGEVVPVQVTVATDGAILMVVQGTSDLTSVQLRITYS